MEINVEFFPKGKSIFCVYNRIKLLNLSSLVIHGIIHVFVTV